MDEVFRIKTFGIRSASNTHGAAIYDFAKSNQVTGELRKASKDMVELRELKSKEEAMASVEQLFRMARTRYLQIHFQLHDEQGFLLDEEQTMH